MFESASREGILYRPAHGIAIRGTLAYEDTRTARTRQPEGSNL
jgi:hypothetical protein